MLLCDGQGGTCSGAAHTTCIGLFTVPDGDWFCRRCAGASDSETGEETEAECHACSSSDSADDTTGPQLRWQLHGFELSVPLSAYHSTVGEGARTIVSGKALDDAARAPSMEETYHNYYGRFRDKRVGLLAPLRSSKLQAEQAFHWPFDMEEPYSAQAVASRLVALADELIGVLQLGWRLSSFLDW